MKELRVYAPAGHLGHGVPGESLKNALRLDPHFIALQGTSMDPGPYYLGSGLAPHSMKVIRRDLELIVPETIDRGIPFIFSATGPGTNNLVEQVLRILNSILKEKGLRARVAVISGELSKEYLKKKLEEGVKAWKLTTHPSLPETLRPRDVEEATHIVAQMGPEPIMDVLDRYKPDIVLTGRALDIALFSAIPLMMGFDKGLVMHMAKILECGALSAEPSTTSDGMFAVLGRDHFLVFPTNPRRRATVTSVAAHSLYERADPFMEMGPDGYLDLSDARYEQVDERTVRVSGSRYVELGRYAVKVEGAKLAGHRSIIVMGARDPAFISSIDYILEETMRRVREVFGHEGYRVYFRVYGRNGVLGPSEPMPRPGHEVGILVEVVARSREDSLEIASFLRSTILHLDFPGCITTAGNVAFPFSPPVLDGGPVYEFNIWHALPLEDPLEPFERRLIELPRGDEP